MQAQVHIGSVKHRLGGVIPGPLPVLAERGPVDRGSEGACGRERQAAGENDCSYNMFFHRYMFRHPWFGLSGWSYLQLLLKSRFCDCVSSLQLYLLF